MLTCFHPVEMLYQQALCTTVPQWIRHTDPQADTECDHLNQYTTESAEYYDQQGYCRKPPFFTSQTISVLNDARNLWFPVTIICKANSGSYLVQVIGGGQYKCGHDHIWECHLDAVKPDTAYIGDVAPAASASAHATQAARPPAAVAPTTPIPAAALPSPCKALLQYIHHNKHRCHPLEPLLARLAQPCCPMLINLKQEATIQASWRDIDLDSLLQMNLMMPWPTMPPA